ncbi:PREDICTED: tetraspanin-9-like [Priapulus caudatus]|uniref:Tetraspanin n=1 Tax=Priapulus caudatus TaxID=37621 RepID=A0ABM1E1S7_PRICU|nr:PREDICTED: tetraspanin-9-like [Priapulus caudatus]
MAVGCGAACAKMLLFVFNFVFWLSGAGLIAVGIWFLVAEENAYILEILGTSSDDELMTVAAWAVIGIGVLVFVIGFLGCCGAIKESKCMLITYFICLLIILVAEVGAGVMAVVYKDSITEFMDKEIPDSLKTSYKDPTMNSYTEAWDWMQVTLECCGTTALRTTAVKHLLVRMKIRLPVTCLIR